MKTEQEKIEEMAKDLEQAKYWAMGTAGSLNNGFGGWYGAYMYNQGYRKASEVIDELVKNIMTDAEPFLSNMSRNLIRMCASKMKKELAAEMRQEVEK